MDNRSGTILIVDDDPRALELMMWVLEEEGYQVQLADSGRLALVSVAAQPPDLVLLDVKMTDMDGYEVCRRLKQSDTGRRIPVMFISGSKEREQWAKGLSLGAVDFVSKPFQREELLARVRAHVELGRFHAQLESRVAQRTAELRNAIEQLQLEMAERRRAEQALRESEQRFRQIANAAPVIIWTSNQRNSVDFRNEYAQAFTGRDMDELTDGRWTEVVHPEDRERRQSARSAAMAARRNFQIEYRLRRADGEYRDVLDRGTPRFLEDGEFAGYVGVIFDLTDVKRAQQRALRESNLESLRVLSAGIAHDFNTMIGAIFGEVHLALTDMLEDSPGRDNLERIDGVAKRAAEIVRLLLAYVGDPMETVHSTLVNLTGTVEEIVPHLKASILKKAKIHTKLDPELPSVRANLQQMRLIVLNLILNAVEALQGEAGLVTIVTEAIEIRDGYQTGNRPDLPDGRYVRLEVADTGRGMTEEVRNRAFDPYYSTKFLGRGLGLAAVQGIIRSHDGAIRAKSSPGEGSEFEVLLPIPKYETAASASQEGSTSETQ